MCSSKDRTSDARTPSPYRPGFGSRPTVIAGHDDLLADVDEAVEGIAQDGWPPARSCSSGRVGWASPQRSMSGGLPFADASATFNRGDERPPPSPAIQLAEQLRQLADLAVAADTGVVIALDEIQGVSKAEFGTFGTFCQEITRRDLPFLVVATGLPTVDNERLPTYFVTATRPASRERPVASGLQPRGVTFDDAGELAAAQGPAGTVGAMAKVKLRRCYYTFLHLDADPCLRLQRALDADGVSYAIVSTGSVSAS